MGGFWAWELGGLMAEFDTEGRIGPDVMCGGDEVDEFELTRWMDV